MADCDDLTDSSRGDGFRFERDRHEVATVEECPVPGCEATFVGMTPDDVRDHLEDDHGAAIAQSIVFPTEEAKRRHDRFVATGPERGSER